MFSYFFLLVYQYRCLRLFVNRFRLCKRTKFFSCFCFESRLILIPLEGVELFRVHSVWLFSISITTLYFVKDFNRIADYISSVYPLSVGLSSERNIREISKCLVLFFWCTTKKEKDITVKNLTLVIGSLYSKRREWVVW